MYKKILSVTIAIVVAVFAGVNVNLNSQNDNVVSDIIVQNIKALSYPGTNGGCSTVSEVYSWPGVLVTPSGSQYGTITSHEYTCESGTESACATGAVDFFNNVETSNTLTSESC